MDTRIDASDSVLSSSDRTRRDAILIVEDEPKLAAILADYLQASHFDTRCIEDGREVAAAVKASRFDLILLDLTLRGCDGLTVCRELRSFTDTPVIMVTARVEEVDRLLGLELGADDYICKPFSPREVVARAKAVLRRARRDAGRPGAPRISIDDAAFTASLDGRALELTPVEFRLLKTLASEPGRIFTRNQVLENLYADHRVVTDRTVDSHVKNLRRKLADICPDEDLIRSIYGVGYKLQA